MDKLWLHDLKLMFCCKTDNKFSNQHFPVSVQEKFGLTYHDEKIIHSFTRCWCSTHMCNEKEAIKEDSFWMFLAKNFVLLYQLSTQKIRWKARGRTWGSSPCLRRILSKKGFKSLALQILKM